MTFERRRGRHTVSTDPARLDVGAIHAFLTTAYWSEGIPRATVARSLAGSLCFGLFEDHPEGEGARQVGLARVITDGATFAYLCDVYVLPERRGAGLGAWLMACVLEHPDLQGLRRFTLVTRDAHELYRRFGFREVANPDRHMEIVKPGLYKEVR